MTDVLIDLTLRLDEIRRDSGFTEDDSVILKQDWSGKLFCEKTDEPNGVISIDGSVCMYDVINYGKGGMITYTFNSKSLVEKARQKLKLSSLYGEMRNK